MKKILVCIVALSILLSVNAQVGIGTTDPDPSAILDIDAADKGMLVPRVFLNDVTDTQLDGLNNAAEGLLIYNTNPTVNGGYGTGFYAFNGSIWLKIRNNKDDKSWYGAGTSDPPGDITDDIYTQGKVSIGSPSPDASSILDISASDKGILIPRVSLSNTYNTKIDGVNTAPTSLLIYNTNPGVVNGSGVGFYYFNGTFWQKLGDNLGNHIASKTLNMNTNSAINAQFYSTNATASYDKFRVFGSDRYTIGMNFPMTYGFLNDWAMTFTMLEGGIGRGWVWREYSDAQNDGAMSLTVDGKLTLKNHMRVDSNTFVVDADNNRVGIGTTTPSEKLEVNGKIKAVDVNFSGLQTYVDNAEALAAGLTAGDLYKTAEGILRIVY